MDEKINHDSSGTSGHKPSDASNEKVTAVGQHEELPADRRQSAAGNVVSNPLQVRYLLSLILALVQPRLTHGK